jgi:O-acetyl-ADP-ribose deacetylase (regulator of RNase III)
MPITLHQGDITRDSAADAIVNAANSSLHRAFECALVTLTG